MRLSWCRKLSFLRVMHVLIFLHISIYCIYICLCIHLSETRWAFLDVRSSIPSIQRVFTSLTLWVVSLFKLLCHILRKRVLLCAGSTPGPSEIGGIPQTMLDKVYESFMKSVWALHYNLHQIAQFWRIQDCSRRLLQNWCGKSSLQVGSHGKDKAMWNLWTPFFKVPSQCEARSKQRTAGRYTMSGTKSRRLSHSMQPNHLVVVMLLSCGFPEMLLWSCPWYCWDPSHLATVACWTCIGPWTQTEMK